MLCKTRTFSFCYHSFSYQLLLSLLSQSLSQSSRLQLRFYTPSSDSIIRKRFNKMADNDETGFKEMNQRFLDSAARGELQNLTSLFGAVNINVKSERGWTALMFAA